MAICYDFDGTLNMSPMQENKFLPSVGVPPEEFWAEVNDITHAEYSDNILMYMMLMLEKAKQAN